MPSRVFVAIELEPAVRAALAAARQAFLRSAPEWRDQKWVDDLDLHVTVKFVGPLADEAVEAAVSSLCRTLSATPPFEIELARVRAVPGGRHTRMLWAESAVGREEGAKLAAAVDAALAPFGVPSEERAFRAHVTLARARTPRRAPAEALEAATEALVAAGAKAMSVREVTVFASLLGRGGPTYSALAHVPLGGD